MPLTDNMLGGDNKTKACFTNQKRKTVGSLNTDAEGRLILADALSLASS